MMPYNALRRRTYRAVSFAFKNHFGDFFLGSQLVSYHRSWWRCRDWDSELSFIDDRGSNVSTMLVLCADVLGNVLESIDEGVSLLVVTVIKDMA